MRTDPVESLNRALEECLSGIDNHCSMEARVLERINKQRRSPRKLTVMMTSVLLALLLTITALAAGALMGLFRVKQTDVSAIRGCAVADEKLFFLSVGGLFTWQPGQEAPVQEMAQAELEKIGLSSNAILFAYQDSIGFLHSESKSVWLLRDKELEHLLTWKEHPDQNVRFDSAVFSNDCLFVKAVRTDAGISVAQLYRLNISTGAWENLNIGNVLEVCTYTDGKLLCLMQEDRHVYLYPLDTTTGQLGTALYSAAEQALRGVAYEANKKCIYAQVNGTLSYWTGNEWNNMQGFSQHFLSDCYAVLKDGYVTVSFDECQFIPFAENQSVPTLTIEGYRATTNVDSDFQQSHPGAAVVRNANPALKAADVQKAILSGDTTDLFHIRLDTDLFEMYREGLIAPLNSSDILLQDASEMLTVIQQGVLIDKQLFAVPSHGFVKVWEYDGERVESFADLLNETPFIKHNWSTSGWTKEDYADYLLSTYIRETDLISGSVTFDSEVFANALMVLQQSTMADDDSARSMSMITTDVLIDLGGALPSGTNSEERSYSLDEPIITKAPAWKIPSGIHGEMLPSLPIDLTVYVLNPNAKHPDLAMAYLEYLSAHRNFSDDAMLKPSLAEPTLRPGVQQQVDWFIEEQRSFDAQHGKETDEKALAARVDAICSAPDSWEVENSKLLTYQKNIVPFLHLDVCPVLSAASKQEGGLYHSMLEVVISYCNDDIPLETCIEELDQLAGMR